jgi:enoyl-CoA hydratase/carnithine racemase
MTTPYTLQVEGSCARLILSRPPANTLDTPLLKALIADIRALAGQPAAKRPRVLLLTSGIAGQFSAGVEPEAILKADMAGRKQVFLTLADFVETVWYCGIPVVADVAGPALAGGAVLATLADFAVFDAALGKVSFSEVKVGLPLPLFVQKLIRSKVNPAAWNDVMLLGKNIDAAEAVRVGFASAAYKTADERDELLKSLIGRISRIAPAAMASTLIDGRREDRPLFAQFRADVEAFAAFLTDDFLGKGLAAVVRGESPRF